MLETLREELEPRGVQVLIHEFKLFIEYLLEEEKRRKLLQRIVNCASKGRTGSLAENIPLLLDYASLAGKWMIFVPADLYPQIFRYTLEALEKAKLAYSAKITSRRDQYASEKELPIIIHVPVSFAFRYIADVAEVMKDVLEGLYVNKKVFFKPDLFTKKRVYSGKANYKSYIYLY